MLKLDANNSIFEPEDKMFPFEYGLFRMDNEFVALPCLWLGNAEFPRLFFFNQENTSYKLNPHEFITLLPSFSMDLWKDTVRIEKTGQRYFMESVNHSLYEYGIGLLGLARFMTYAAQHIWTEKSLEQANIDYGIYLMTFQYNLVKWVAGQPEVREYQVSTLAEDVIAEFANSLECEAEILMYGLEEAIDMYFQEQDRENLYSEIHNDENDDDIWQTVFEKGGENDISD